MAGSKCKICGGSGIVEKQDDRPRKDFEPGEVLARKIVECECAFWDRVASTMPAYILSAHFSARHLESPLMGAVRKSCFIQGAWVDVRAIIKAVMMKHYDKLFRVTSDRELKDVWIGSKSRSNAEDDAKVVYNSVEDLMGGGDQKSRPLASPDLVIVRLNELGYKNKAAPGVLEEALCCRIDYGRPTWVLSDLDKPFGTGSYSYSESVWDILTTRLSLVRVPRITPRVELPPPDPDERPVVRARPDSASPEPPEEDVRPSPAPERPERAKRVQSVPDEDMPKGLGMYGSGLGSKKKTFGGPKKPFGRGE
jgi:hypothetical protein